MRRKVLLAGAISGAFLLGWFLGPGKDSVVLRTTALVDLIDQNNAHLGTLPVGTQVMSDFQHAPDVGFVGCVPIGFGDSIPASRLFEVAGRLYFDLFHFEDRKQKVYIGGQAPALQNPSLTADLLNRRTIKETIEQDS